MLCSTTDDALGDGAFDSLRFRAGSRDCLPGLRSETWAPDNTVDGRPDAVSPTQISHSGKNPWRDGLARHRRRTSWPRRRLPRHGWQPRHLNVLRNSTDVGVGQNHVRRYASARPWTRGRYWRRVLTNLSLEIGFQRVRAGGNACCEKWRVLDEEILHCGQLNLCDHGAAWSLGNDRNRRRAHPLGGQQSSFHFAAH